MTTLRTGHEMSVSPLAGLWTHARGPPKNPSAKPIINPGSTKSAGDDADVHMVEAVLRTS